MVGDAEGWAVGRVGNASSHACDNQSDRVSLACQLAGGLRLRPMGGLMKGASLRQVCAISTANTHMLLRLLVIAQAVQRGGRGTVVPYCYSSCKGRAFEPPRRNATFLPSIERRPAGRTRTSPLDIASATKSTRAAPGWL